METIVCVNPKLNKESWLSFMIIRAYRDHRNKFKSYEALGEHGNSVTALKTQYTETSVYILNDYFLTIFKYSWFSTLNYNFYLNML